MVGDLQTVIDELIDFSKEISEGHRMIPYVAFVVKDGVVVSRGYNYERESQDITMFSGVTAVRWAQDALDTGDLKGYSLYSFFEPTLLDFDVALWSGIRDFVWCISAASLPKHYSPIPYRINDFVKHNPGVITVKGGVEEKSALALVKSAQENRYWPEMIYS